MLKYLRDRKRMGYLVGSFLLVLVIFAFVVFYIPDLLAPAGGVGLTGEVARVDGISISAQQFLQRYRLQEQVYRAQLGQQYSPALMRQLGLEDLVLRGLIQDALLVVEAERQGLTVSDEEVANRIVRDPTFQSNGQFIGRSAYLQTLSQNGLTAGQFEAELRNQILRQKLQTLVTDGVLVSSEEVEREYRNRNEMAKLEYVQCPRSRSPKAMKFPTKRSPLSSRRTRNSIGCPCNARSDTYRSPLSPSSLRLPLANAK